MPRSLMTYHLYELELPELALIFAREVLGWSEAFGYDHTPGTCNSDINLIIRHVIIKDEQTREDRNDDDAFVSSDPKSIMVAAIKKVRV